MRKLAVLMVAVLFVSFAMPVVVSADDTEPIHTKEVMQIAHRPPQQLLKKTALGQATDAEKAELLKLYKAMAKNAPPRGDATSWQEKTAALVAAAQAAVDGAADARAQLEKASNCAACHSEHK
jgi:hypothetical protein